MAKQFSTRLVDDVDGSEAHETVKFALDGRSYEIDLSVKNAAKLRGALASYLDHGTRVGGGRAASKRRGGPTVVGPSRDDNQTIRAWALQQGYEVASRGRISQEIIELYRQHAS